MKSHTSTIVTHVHPATKNKIIRLARESGQSVSQVMREMAESYCDDTGVSCK